jgi:hypothetical protein
MTKQAFAAVFIVSSIASTTSAQQEADKPSGLRPDSPTKLSLFTGAGYLATQNGNGGAVSTGVRLAVGNYFALGFDLGYGVMALPTSMQDRWWFIPSMAAVVPMRIFNVRNTLDIGAGLGLGTASGYASFSEYSSHPFTADWEFQVEPAVRAHAIWAVTVSPTLDVYARADAAALVLPHGSSPNLSDSTWLMFSLGTRFRVL